MGCKMYKKKANYEERDYQQELTNKFIQRIELALSSIENGLSWDKPFVGSSEFPRNALTGEKYHGANIAALMVEEFPDPRWLTFNQIQELSKKLDKPLHLEKGSKATFVMKVVVAYQKDANGEVIKDDRGQPLPLTHDDGTPKIGFKWYPVFNASQVAGIDKYEKKINLEVKPFETVTLLQQALIERTGLKIEHNNQGKAAYSSELHKIYMPKHELFKSSEGYADTFLHEAGHSTGPALGRKMGNKFGSKEYAYEELVAELTSSFMSVELNIPHNPSTHENQAAYLKSWLEALKNDKTMITKASNLASKATEYQMEHFNEYKKSLTIGQEEQVDEKEKVVAIRKSTPAVMRM